MIIKIYLIAKKGKRSHNLRSRHKQTSQKQDNETMMKANQTERIIKHT